MNNNNYYYNNEGVPIYNPVAPAPVAPAPAPVAPAPAPVAPAPAPVAPAPAPVAPAPVQNTSANAYIYGVFIESYSGKKYNTWTIRVYDGNYYTDYPVIMPKSKQIPPVNTYTPCNCTIKRFWNKNASRYDTAFYGV